MRPMVQENLQRCIQSLLFLRKISWTRWMDSRISASSVWIEAREKGMASKLKDFSGCLVTVPAAHWNVQPASLSKSRCSPSDRCSETRSVPADFWGDHQKAGRVNEFLSRLLVWAAPGRKGEIGKPVSPFLYLKAPLWRVKRAGTVQPSLFLLKFSLCFLASWRKWRVFKVFCWHNSIFVVIYSNNLI